MSHADLRLADLSGADMQGVDLHAAIEEGAKYDKANMKGVKRTDADLFEAENYKGK